MTRLFLVPGQEIPHTEHPFEDDVTACGKPLYGMREVTELQALVWLGNHRCARCGQHAATAAIVGGTR